ncbi:hypothetical protein OAR88_00160 [bacterium]|nr:hypothetical protein [bacterium]
MSLYKDASLAMIPSAYKDGKLYSIRPTDGSGDFTFSRGSNLAATRVDVNGLIEKGRENLLLQSNQFDTTWTQSRITITGNQAGYDGSNDAWLIESTATAQSSRIHQNYTSTGVVNRSVYAKKGTADYLAIYTTGDAKVYFNLSTGTIDTQSQNISASIESVGNGWYRCNASFGSGYDGHYIFIAATNNSTTTNSGDNIFIQDAQLEQGLVATDYIETGASTAQAGILEDMPRLDYSGGASCPSLLLEPQRTNQAESSEQFNNTAHWVNSEGTTITANDATSPEGVQNAFKLVPFATDAYHRIFEGGSITTGNPYTFSIFAKAGGYRYMLIRNNGIGSTGQSNIGVDLQEGTITYADSDYDSYDIEDYGNGWYRIWGAGVAAQNTYNIGIRFQNYEQVNSSISTFTGDGTSGGYVYGWQVEAGSYPTSYIPTYGSSVTRSKESFNMNLQSQGIFESSDTQGVLMIEYEKPNTGENIDIVRFMGASANGRGFIYNSGVNFASDWAGGVSGVIDHDGNNKTIWRLNTLSAGNMFHNGSKLGGEATGTAWSDIRLLRFNMEGLGGVLKIKQILLFPTALTDSECIALTTL